MHGAVFRSPDDESGVIAYFGERRFQFREVCRPVPYDAQTIMEHVVLEHRHKVAIERIGWNSGGIAEHAAQPDVVKGTPARERVEEKHGTEGAPDKGRESLAMP